MLPAMKKARSVLKLCKITNKISAAIDTPPVLFGKNRRGIDISGFHGIVIFR